MIIEGWCVCGRKTKEGLKATRNAAGGVRRRELPLAECGATSVRRAQRTDCPRAAPLLRDALEK